MYSPYFSERPVETIENWMLGWTETAIVDRFLDESPQLQFLISGELYRPTMRYHTTGYQSLVAELVLVSADLQPVGPEKRITLDVSEPLGNLIKSEINYPIPEDILTGKYLFKVSLFEPTGGTTLAVYDDSNRYSLRDYAYAGNVTIANQASPIMPLDEGSGRLWQNESDALLLFASDVAVTYDLLEVTTMWEAVNNTPYSNYTSFVHILDGDGHLVAQSDSQPQEGRMPTNMWLLSEKVIDQQSIELTSLLAMSIKSW